MGKQSRIWTGYLVFCGILVVLFIYLSGNMPTRGAYTWQEFQTAVEQEQIEAVEIEQNREIPTGSVNALLKDGTEVSFYVSNVADVEKLLQYYDLQYTLDDVPGESIFSNVVLPLQQINDRRYDVEMTAGGVQHIFKFGVAFCGKKVEVSTE